MADALSSSIQKIVDQRVIAALAPHAAALNELAAFLRSSGLKPAARRGRPAGATAVRAVTSGVECAIIGCARPARSKGYCAAHYQKFNNLKKSHRLPGDWADPAEPQSVQDIVLPRGRAAQKAKKVRN